MFSKMTSRPWLALTMVGADVLAIVVGRPQLCAPRRPVMLALTSNLCDAMAAFRARAAGSPIAAMLPSVYAKAALVDLPAAAAATSSNQQQHARRAAAKSITDAPKKPTPTLVATGPGEGDRATF